MKILSVLFGRCCLFCGKTVDQFAPSEICAHCAQAIEEENLALSSGEVGPTVSLYWYEGPVRLGLHRFKYGGKIALGKVCGRRLGEEFLRRGEQAEVITCVPRAKDGRPRLYNQSRVLAKEMAKVAGLPLDDGLLFKRKGMLTQPECPTRLARQENAKKAFRKGPSLRDLSGKTVVLVDDLYTSGATTEACSAILKKRGAARVLVYTACRAKPGNVPKLRRNFESKPIHFELSDPTPYRLRYKIKRGRVKG